MLSGGQITEEKNEKNSSSTVFISLLLLLVVLLAAFLFINSSFFIVGTVAVEGSNYLSAQEICQIAGVPERVNIFRLNTGEIRERLTGDLRIAKVEVERRFPATIAITVTERKPTAFLASGFGFVEIDSQGVVLAAHKNIKAVKVPVITGLRTGNVFVGDKVAIDQIQPVLKYLAALDEITLNQLAEVNVDGGKLSAYTTASVYLRLGNTDRMEEKAKLTVNILREITEKKLSVDSVDLTYASPFIKTKL